jgi:hypothetical protein
LIFSSASFILLIAPSDREGIPVAKFMDPSTNDREQPEDEPLDTPTEPDWSKIRSSDVDRAVEKRERDEDLSPEEESIHSRWAEFESFWSDRVFPPGDQSLLHEAFLEVMTRISSEVFDVLTSKIWIVILSSHQRALNIPLRETIPPRRKPLTLERDVVVFSDESRKLSPQARVGLVAHELAHSCVEKPNHLENEGAADDFVRSWGFSQELEALRKE